MTAYGYARVSTTRQVEDGDSLDTQQRTLRGYALMQGVELERVFVEQGVSGSKPLQDRPEGGRLLAALQPGDIIITPKLDRMFRSALDALAVLAELKARSIALHMLDLGGDVTSNGISKLVFTILSAVAEAERDRIRERIGEVKRDAKSRGAYLGGKVPYGSIVVDGHLQPDPAKISHVNLIRSMRAAGRSLRSIQAALAERGDMLSLMGISGVLDRAPSESIPILA